jgi:hypothetical protein
VYRFDKVPTGQAELTFRLINFSLVRRIVNVTSGGTVTANAVMHVATSADIVITAPRTFRNLAEIENPAENLVGVASAGSEGAITATQLAVRPVNRATEVLETVPGLVISQHSGEGKANQYYLRGFNLDHGFDFAQTVAGVPVNMPTHAHAQGYADSNFLIPELVSGVQFRKGPYYAENGDFSSAGSANVNYFNVLDRPMVTLSGGSFGYGRFLGAASPRVGEGNLLVAMEWERDNGPWVSPNNKDKYNSVVRYSQGDARNGLSLTFMGFSNHWHSTDQIPQRAVDEGLISRFGFIEETDGGETFRYNGTFDWQKSGTNDSTRLTGYVQRYGVQLFHNFTYFLNDPINGDQFEQFERRWTSGAKLTHRRLFRFGEKLSETAFGVDVRNDVVGGPLGLYLTRATERLSAVREDEVNQTSVGTFVDTEIEWARTFRTTFGVRGDVYRWNVQSDNPLNSGERTSGILSPKVSAAFGPWRGHRAVRELGSRLSLQFRARSHAAGGSLHGRTGGGVTALRARTRCRVRLENGRHSWPADDRYTVVPRLRFGADLRRGLGQHGSRTCQSPDGRRNHQLCLSQPLGRPRSRSVVLPGAVPRRPRRRRFRSRRAEPCDLGRHRGESTGWYQRGTIRQSPPASFRPARTD